MHRPPLGMSYPKARLFYLTSAAGEANPRKRGSLLFHHLAIIQDNRGEKKKKRNTKQPQNPKEQGKREQLTEEKESAIPKHGAVAQPNQTVMIH